MPEEQIGERPLPQWEKDFRHGLKVRSLQDELKKARQATRLYREIYESAEQDFIRTRDELHALRQTRWHRLSRVPARLRARVRYRLFGR